MAKEKKPDFNAEEFIEQFRESAVPTYHRAPAKNASTEKEVSAQKTKKTTEVSERLHPELERLINLNLSDEEREYVVTFLTNNFQRVNQSGRPLVIRQEYIEMIEKVRAFLRVKVSLAGYIDNVLTEHFSKQFTNIQGLFDKNPPKF